MACPLPVCLLLCLLSPLLGAGTAWERAEPWPDMPDGVGRAGMYAGVVDDGGVPTVMMAGGANFPAAKPWEGGSKVFHRQIWIGRAGAWRLVGALPQDLAYGAGIGTARGLVIAGGADARGHTGRCWLVGSDGSVRDLPTMPEPTAFAAYARLGSRLLVLGGCSSPDAVSASRRVVALDLGRLDDPALRWSEEPELPAPGRILATAGVLDGRLIIAGGCALSADDQGRPQRQYLTAVACAERGAWRTLPDLPAPRAACAGPAPARDGGLYLIGGDTGRGNGLPPQDRPANSDTVWRLDLRRGAWDEADWTWPTPIATAPVVAMGDLILSVGGETRPGVRTPAVTAATLVQRWRFTTVDALAGLLGLLGVGLMVAQALRRGLGGVRSAADPGTAPGRQAWLVVGLLWVVATLNYLDRNIIAAMHDPLVQDVPQSEYQFGLLTGVFLIIYATVSPLGGFLADRFSRRLVILVSLIVWSAVTWLTGHASGYGELLGARALMGISEACYIPAALALITDHHRGRTRSLATGIHMSGVYAGASLAGIGGLLAQSLGWRLAFSLLGLVGVAYALVLILLLKDQDDGGRPVPAAASIPVDRLSPATALRSLFGAYAFWLLLVVVGSAGMTNWLLLTWLPKLLQDKFDLGLAAAGISATLPATIAKYAAVVLGALLADAWSARQARARSLLPGIAFLLAGPLIGLCFLTDTLWIFLACIAAQGVAQGVLDATLMPVLRQHIDGRCAATGYGFLNLVSAGLGAAATIGGGRLLDAGISLDATLACSGAGLVLAGLLLVLIPAPHTEKDPP